MNKLIITLLFALAATPRLAAQEPAALPTDSTHAVPAQAQPYFGYLNADSLLRSLPEYADAMQQLAELKQKYQTEAHYNETSFRRQFAEFLEGQKDFTENILLKRQADLQESMEKGLAFRHQADSLLRQTEAEMLQSLRTRLNAAISAVGAKRGLSFVLDTSTGAFPYLNPKKGEDITEAVKQALR